MAENQPSGSGSDQVRFLGEIETPFNERRDCPRNVRLARERGGTALIRIHPPYRAGLLGLDRYSHVLVLYWMDEAERDLLVQHPSHADGPRGVFAIRSPARPNPIALAAARLVAVDAEAGTVEVEQLDCRSGTPLLDIKPYLPSVDAVPEATGRP
jgi:tRNA-Thr(GGU) m(6)t(6)A37 methyltransferase TsaA